MNATMPVMEANQKETYGALTFKRDNLHEMLAGNIEDVIAAARPRLLQIARMQGVTPDAIDDVVQETLVEAWRHFKQLRSPERFDAWLGGICRNMCWRWKRAQGITKARQIDLSVFSTETEGSWQEEMADPSLLDPAEELSRQDMVALLDRALGYLPTGERAAVEMHYLADLPQHEAAQHLGLSIKALEVRLVRARRQLRHILSNELRVEAETFGLVLTEDVNTGWRETRIQCMFCGHHCLQGRFETLPDGRVDLIMRCPDCLDHLPRAWIKTGGFYELCGLKTFRPAWNRMQRMTIERWSTFMQRCSWCQTASPLRLIGPTETPVWLPPWRGLRFVRECPACKSNSSFLISSLAWLHPLVQDFTAQHPRWINEPEILAEYAGQPAFRVRITDITSAARLTLMLHRETLEVLASFQE